MDFAAARANERDHCVRRAGAGEALLAFLEAVAQAVGTEPLFGFDADGMMVLAHQGLLHCRSGSAATPRPPQTHGLSIVASKC